MRVLVLLVLSLGLLACQRETPTDRRARGPMDRSFNAADAREMQDSLLASVQPGQMVVRVAGNMLNRDVEDALYRETLAGDLRVDVETRDEGTERIRWRLAGESGRGGVEITLEKRATDALVPDPSGAVTYDQQTDRIPSVRIRLPHGRRELVSRSGSLTLRWREGKRLEGRFFFEGQPSRPERQDVWYEVVGVFLSDGQTALASR